MEIKIPELSLVVLVGVTSSGKSTFAKRLFKPTEIISSDECRAIVSDDANNQSATNDAFNLLYYIAEKRLKNGLLTVIDATNVQRESRRGLIELARKYHCIPVAIVLDLPNNICQERNKQREDRKLGKHVIRQQSQQLRSSLRNLTREGFRYIHTLKSVEEIDNVSKITREKLYNDKRELSGPFDIIGDIHGCFDELKELLEKLNYKIENSDVGAPSYGYNVTHPENRKVVFVGDLTDRGPNAPEVLRLVMSMVNSGIALCVAGNHDAKLQIYLSGKPIKLEYGLDVTAEQLENESDEFKNEARQFLRSLVSHYTFDDGKLVVAHAGIKEEMQGRASGAVRSFCIFGELTGEIDEYGVAVRYNWAKDYRGEAKVVYGHTPIVEAEWVNRTINIDTACVFGGKLTALRYPEEELVEVKAKKTYTEPSRPIFEIAKREKLSKQQEYDGLLNIEDVIGKRIIQTKLLNNITIREENSIAALEVMSRFAINPKWLIYLPPTMSPTKTSKKRKYLEYPHEALDYYQENGVKKVICEEKHMGSRAVLIVCKDEEAAVKRFGIKDEGIGICYTRTGRNFFNNSDIEKEFIDRVNKALTATSFWDKFQTDWVCLDTELMPWSAKAQALIKDQYAAVGAAANGALPVVEKSLQMALDRGVKDAEPFLKEFTNKKESINKYIKSYQNYCWDVEDINDFKLAPFHILATEGKVHSDKSHEWHMNNIEDLYEGDKELFLKTKYQIVELNDDESYNKAVEWWLKMTNNGGEGMVVKPYDFITYGKKGILQPAVKCRGAEYLRIIYGPEYDSAENIERLKKRSIHRKQSLAIREFALGMEALERFVSKEPLRKVHESVFAVLALESEEVDPRL